MSEKMIFDGDALWTPVLPPLQQQQQQRPTQSSYSREKVRLHALDLITICEQKRYRGKTEYRFRYDGDAADAHCLSATVMSTSKLFTTPDVRLEGSPGEYNITIEWQPLPAPKPRKPKIANNNSNKRPKLDDSDIL
jgi:hypothetical protein